MLFAALLVVTRPYPARIVPRRARLRAAIAYNSRVALESVRAFCLNLPGTTEDVKWGSDLCFLIGGKMFAVVNLDPPHQISFKTTPERFAELVERDGVKPAPYLARAMWVQQEALGEALGRRELESLLKQAYEIVAARLPRSRRPADSRTRTRASQRRSRKGVTAKRR
jgi:predicted DNA-binding protein (MmcQ/YjbR family)